MYINNGSICSTIKSFTNTNMTNMMAPPQGGAITPCKVKNPSGGHIWGEDSNSGFK